MRFANDNTGRFDLRPFYEDAELDSECENIITSFIKRKHGEVTFPIPTDTLTALIECDVEELNLYADLTNEGIDVHGVTDFTPGKKPIVRIEKTLLDDSTEHRLRTTLSHEYGHVHFHTWLFDRKAQNLDLFSDEVAKQTHKCHRDTIVGASQVDWMEWQAGYVFLAFLMPVTHLHKVVTDFHERHDIPGPLTVGTVPASNLKRVVSKIYHVSDIAAHYWLLKRGYLTMDAAAPRIIGLH